MPSFTCLVEVLLTEASWNKVFLIHLHGRCILAFDTSSEVCSYNLAFLYSKKKNKSSFPIPPTIPTRWPPSPNPHLTSSPDTPHKTTSQRAPSSSPRNSNETTHTDTPHYRMPPCSHSSRSGTCNTSARRRLRRLPCPHRHRH